MAGAPCGTAVIAREQVTGQGRQGRVWHSPPGNLYLSVVLRPSVPLARGRDGACGGGGGRGDAERLVAAG
jgi:BirA family biotin operon repressor/biotin-[acetyl-CoA-carboxylase] ligase